MLIFVVTMKPSTFFCVLLANPSLGLSVGRGSNTSEIKRWPE